MPGRLPLLQDRAQVTASLPLSVSLPLFFSSPFSSPSICLPLSSRLPLSPSLLCLHALPPPSSFSLFCTDTLVKSAHYVLRWPCIAFYIWHKAVKGKRKEKKEKRSPHRKNTFGLVSFKSKHLRVSISHQCRWCFPECVLVIGAYAWEDRRLVTIIIHSAVRPMIWHKRQEHVSQQE